MGGAIHGALLIVIASCAFFVVHYGAESAWPLGGELRAACLMLFVNVGFAGLALVLYAWALHGISALGVGLSIGVLGLGTAYTVAQSVRSRPTQR